MHTWPQCLETSGKKPMKPGGAPLPVQGASVEKNTWWAYLWQAFASRPTTHRWHFVNNECQTTPGGAPLPVQGAPAEKNRGARWACLTGRPSSTSPETIRRRRTARPCAPSDTCGPKEGRRNGVHVHGRLVPARSVNAGHPLQHRRAWSRLAQLRELISR